MTKFFVARVRSFLVRAVAVVAVVLTYALATAGTHVLSVAGVTGLALTTSATPANAHWRRRRRRRRRRFCVRRRRRLVCWWG
jgi:hypothetical protein